MKAKRSSLVVVLAATLAAPSAATDLTLSSATIRSRPAPLEYRLGYDKPHSTVSRGSIGFGRVLGEGPVLEVGIWGGGGAVIGSLAGPLGTVVGAAAGTVAGLIVSAFTPSGTKPNR